MTRSRGASGPPRIPPLPEEELTEDALALATKLREVFGLETEALPDSVATMLRHPELYRAQIEYVARRAAASALAARDLELIILRTARLCRSDYIWGEHVRFGKKGGLTRDEIERIVQGSGADGWNARDRALNRLCEELHETSFVSDETWEVIAFDWRAEEKRLNRFDHGITEIDDQPVHFVHARSGNPDAPAILLVHGWPGSFQEFLDAIPLLTDPPDGGPGFHVVVPDVPGFGWSAPTRRRGWNSRRTAIAFGELMTRLGYERFGLQGGDVGAAVTRNMADLQPDRALGLHLNFCLIEPYEGAPTPTEDEQREMARLQESRKTSMGYLIQQSTKPQTLGMGLQDSPAGLLAWIAEKLQAWSDSGGDLFRAFTPDQVLSWVTLYWVSGCITSSLRIYWESRVGGAEALPRRRIEVPTGVTDFPGERARSPRSWIEEHYNLVHYTILPRGGHFAAIEQPELFAADVATFFRGLR